MKRDTTIVGCSKQILATVACVATLLLFNFWQPAASRPGGGGGAGGGGGGGGFGGGGGPAAVASGVAATAGSSAQGTQSAPQNQYNDSCKNSKKGCKQK